MGGFLNHPFLSTELQISQGEIPGGVVKSRLRAEQIPEAVHFCKTVDFIQPVWLSGGVLSREPRDHRFHSQLGHMPGL